MKTNKKIIYIAIAAVVIISLFVYFDFVKQNVVPQTPLDNKSNEDWLSDNCDCIEHERLKCPATFTLTNGSCIRGNEFTNLLKGCSKYDCSGEIINFTG